MEYRTERKYENLEKRLFRGVGEFDIPELEPTQLSGACEFIPFNYALSTRNFKNKGIHFFIDDYQFNRLWAYPDRYIGVLSKFKYVMTPDFSIYTDFPKAIQIYNHYRKHWLGKYFQEHGIPMIPTISWGGEESYEWCFSGEPTEGCIAVSSVGCNRNKMGFLAGYREMLKRLDPAQIIFYGQIPEECEGNIIRLSAFQEKFEKRKDRV